MSSTFIGCTACNTMLILTTDTDAPKRAVAAGWRTVDSGWQCPRHTASPPSNEPEPEREILAPEPSPAVVGTD